MADETLFIIIAEF